MVLLKTKTNERNLNKLLIYLNLFRSAYVQLTVSKL